MNALNICLLIVSFNLAAGEEPLCGHVQELSRATLRPSSEVLIYTGPYFYHYDLETAKLGEKYSLEKYYKGAPTDMESVLLYNANKTAMLFAKGKTMYAFMYEEGAFADSDHLLDKKDKMSLQTMVARETAYKILEYDAMAYNAKVKLHDYKLIACIKEEIQHCSAVLRPNRPIDNCKPYDNLKEYGKSCRGLAIAEFDGNLFLVLANEEDILLLVLDENGQIDPKPHKRLSLATIFSCRSAMLFIVIPLICILLVSVIVVSAVVIAIWMKRRKGKRTDGEITVNTADTTVDTNVKMYQNGVKKAYNKI